MKNQKSPEELYQYLRNQRGFEIARRSLLRQMEWFEPTALENAIANTYGMLMVANGGNKDESIKFILKIYQPENLSKLFKMVENNEEVNSELVNEILN
jgi:hypothetical protein